MGGLLITEVRFKQKPAYLYACSYYKGGVWERFFRAQDKSLTCRNERRNTSLNNVHSLNGYPAHLKNVSLYLTTTYISYFRFTASLWSRMYLRSIV